VDAKLRRFLRRSGATAEEIERAEAEGWLTLLTFDRLLMPGSPRFDLADVASAVATDVPTVSRLWRALGFPDLPTDARFFTDADIEAGRLLADRVTSGVLVTEDETIENVLQQVRVVSAIQARLAEVLTDGMMAAAQAARSTGLTDEQLAVELMTRLDWPTLTRLNDYLLRLQTRAALWRRLALDDPRSAGTRQLAVGFVDLVGYTSLSQELDTAELSGLVRRFEQLAYETVAERGGRVVKMIGDEVMFVADAVAVAASIALRLTERSAVDEVLPEARAGLALGPVLSREGDYYGPVVNLASRLTDLARPGSVLVPEAVHDALEGDASFRWRRLRSRRIRDIGRIEVWALAASGSVADDRG
jgi:adenylate cyclase